MTGNPRNAMVCDAPYLQNQFGDPHFFFGRSLPFLFLSVHFTKKQKKNLYVGSFNYFAYTLQKEANWYMDSGLRDLEVAFLKANST